MHKNIHRDIDGNYLDHQVNKYLLLSQLFMPLHVIFIHFYIKFLFNGLHFTESLSISSEDFTQNVDDKVYVSILEI